MTLPTKFSALCHTTSAEEAAQYGLLGWELLAIAPGQHSEGTAYFLYSLIWTGSKDAVPYPESAKPHYLP